MTVCGGPALATTGVKVRKFPTRVAAPETDVKVALTGTFESAGRVTVAPVRALVRVTPEPGRPEMLCRAFPVPGEKTKLRGGVSVPGLTLVKEAGLTLPPAAAVAERVTRFAGANETMTLCMAPSAGFMVVV
jgi:hypothetical protein